MNAGQARRYALKGEYLLTRRAVLIEAQHADEARERHEHKARRQAARDAKDPGRIARRNPIVTPEVRARVEAIAQARLPNWRRRHHGAR